MGNAIKTPPETTQKVMDIICHHLYEQNRKGVEKYGETIDQAKNSDYDWQNMALQELTDCIQYVTKENEKLKKQLENDPSRQIATMLQREYALVIKCDMEELMPGLHHAKMMTESILKDDKNGEL